MSAPGWTDQKVENAIGVLLQSGVLIAGAVVLAGGVLYLIHFGATPAHYSVFAGEPAELTHIALIVKAAFHLDSRAIIQLGLILLIATPVSRVVFSIAAFWLQRDRLYVSVTCIVLAILLYSLIAGGR